MSHIMRRKKKNWCSSGLIDYKTGNINIHTHVYNSANTVTHT